MISEKEAEHVARLARIELKEGESAKIAEELSAVLEYIDQLNSVNTENIEPLYQTTGLINGWRSDQDGLDPKLKKGLLTNLIQQAPENDEDDFLKVKEVIKKS